MLINLNDLLKDVEGTPMLDQNKSFIPLKSVICQKLLEPQANATANTLLEKDALAKKIYSSREAVEFTVQEAAMIIQAALESGAPLIYTQVNNLINANAQRSAGLPADNK